jgi:hypothetical protein
MLYATYRYGICYIQMTYLYVHTATYRYVICYIQICYMLHTDMAYATYKYVICCDISVCKHRYTKAYACLCKCVPSLEKKKQTWRRRRQQTSFFVC